jgi:hypothetical membrane protein
VNATQRSAALGVAAVVVSLVAILAATFAAPWFSWTGNALSDLGTSDAPERLLFNYGLIAAGLLGLWFVPALLATASSVGRAAVLPYMAAMLGVTGVGLFPAGTALHFPAAATAYLGFVIAPLLHGIGDLRVGRTRRGAVAVADGFVHLLFWVLWGTTLTGVLPGLAVPEFVGSTLFNAWAVWVAVRAWSE